MKSIGPSFTDELKFAGLIGLPFSWCSDGSFTFGPDMPPELQSAVLSVYASHYPESPPFATQKAAEIAIWKDTREKMCGRLASIASRFRTSGDVAGAASCDAVADSLLGLFTDVVVTAAVDISSYKGALKARYKQAIVLATPSAAAEFGKYDK